MGKQGDEWLDDSVDETAFERTLEGQTILGTGGPTKGEDVIYLSEPEED